jgi:hypothetical protein
MLTSRKINSDDAEFLSLEELDAAELSRRLGEPVPPGVTAIQIPYFEPDGSPLLKQGGEPYVRYRLYGPFTDEMSKYTQVKGSGLAAYLPQLGIDWFYIAHAPSMSLWITEGEFKAIRVCQRWTPCIGIRGVGNWQTQNGRLARPLDSFVWGSRTVYIAFDADEGCGLIQPHKPQVAGAIHKLANRLDMQGARVYCLYIARTSTYNDSKMGVDDFDDAGGDFDELISTATRM